MGKNHRDATTLSSLLEGAAQFVSACSDRLEHETHPMRRVASRDESVTVFRTFVLTLFRKAV
jgi:hypothetical protein